MKPIIKVENLSKQYRLGTIGAGTMREDVQRWWHKVRGKEDPYLKIGETNDQRIKGNSGYVWALKDINFEVMPGEVLGIIGKNGAGKSTLLKILSNVTGPTTGNISYNGRIGSLLEVGTGFHPDLTGRENIFLNGAILGMTKREIRSRLDEIIDFSGCERYIDTPVKRYSSGMTVRLGFAVAAYLEPEILIVDEVLAVGDAEFQKKAIGKMQDVSRDRGRTVLFVSHNMAAVKNLCKSGIVLNHGTIRFNGEVNEAMSSYINQIVESETTVIKNVANVLRTKGRQNAIKRVWIENENNLPTLNFLMGAELTFCFEFEMSEYQDNIDIGFGVENLFGNRIFSLNNEILNGFYFNNVKYGIAKFKIPDNILQSGKYYLSVSIVSGGKEWIDYLPQAIAFFVESADIYGSGKLADNSQGIVSIRGEIELKKVI